MNNLDYWLGTIETAALLVALGLALYVAEIRWFLRLASWMNRWTVLAPLAAAIVIFLLLAAIEYLTRARPLHMVMRT